MLYQSRSSMRTCQSKDSLSYRNIAYLRIYGSFLIKLSLNMFLSIVSYRPVVSEILSKFERLLSRWVEPAPRMFRFIRKLVGHNPFTTIYITRDKVSDLLDNLLCERFKEISSITLKLFYVSDVHIYLHAKFFLHAPQVLSRLTILWLTLRPTFSIIRDHSIFDCHC